MKFKEMFVVHPVQFLLEKHINSYSALPCHQKTYEKLSFIILALTVNFYNFFVERTPFNFEDENMLWLKIKRPRREITDSCSISEFLEVCRMTT